MARSESQGGSESQELIDAIVEAVSWELFPSDIVGDRASTNAMSEIGNAMGKPVDFPPITQAVIPGDQVVLTVDAMIPNLPDLMVAVIDHFSESQIGGLEVVLSQEASDDLTMDIAAAVGKTATVSRHDHAKRDALMYLMADADGEPVYLNRKIVDADFVLPIQAQHAGGDFDRLSLEGAAGIYPVFADSASQGRLRALVDSGSDTLRLFQRDLGMTLGVQVLLQVQVTADGVWQGFQCGTPSVLSIPTASATDQRPSLDYIVCCVEGDAHQQTWANLARAASSVMEQVDESTTVILWSSIKTPPSNRLRHAILSDRTAQESDGDDETIKGALDVLNNDGFPDKDVMDDVGTVLSRLLERCRVMVRSEVDDETIEELGFGVLQNAEQLKTLIAPGSTCGLVRSAQFCGDRILR